MALVEIGITGNGGYSPDQVRKMSVGELVSELENFDSNDEIYLHDEGNRYGAAYGYINYVSEGKSNEDDDEYYESNLYSMIKSNQKLNEADDKENNTDSYLNLYKQLAELIEEKYNINDLVNKIDDSSKAYFNNNVLSVGYMVVPFINSPLDINFEFDEETSKFRVRAILHNPDSTSFWSDALKGITLLSGKYEDGNIRLYKNR